MVQAWWWALAVLCFPLQLRAHGVESVVHWYHVRLFDDIIGYMYTLLDANSSNIHYVEEMNFGVHRGRDTVIMFAQTTSNEHVNGTLKDMDIVQKTSQHSIKSQFSFNGTGFKVYNTGASFEREGDFVKLAATAAPFWSRVGAQHQFERSCRTGETFHDVRTVRPEVGAKVVSVTRRLVDPPSDAPTHDGLFAGSSRWETMIEGVPMKIYETYSSDCSVLLQSEVDTPFGSVVVTKTTQESVQPTLQKFLAGDFSQSKFPEIVNSASVLLEKTIPTVLKATSASFLVGHSETDAELANISFPSIGYQQFEPIRDGSEWAGRVFIDLSAPQQVEAGVEAVEKYLKASTMINSDDPAVVALHTQLLQNANLPATSVNTPRQFGEVFHRASILRQGVRKFIKIKDLNTGYGSASETIISRAGDCTEHAVLLAALLRVDGVPSRVCSGMVYSQHFNSHGGAPTVHAATPVMAWHMWTQALIDGAWVDFDATLPVDFHVGHIAISTDALNEATVISQSVLAMLPLLNRLRVSVETVEGIPLHALRTTETSAVVEIASVVDDADCSQRVEDGDTVEGFFSIFSVATGELLGHSLRRTRVGLDTPLGSPSVRHDSVDIRSSTDLLTTRDGVPLPTVVVEKGLFGMCDGELRSITVPVNELRSTRVPAKYGALNFTVEVSAVVKHSSKEL